MKEGTEKKKIEGMKKKKKVLSLEFEFQILYSFYLDFQVSKFHPQPHPCRQATSFNVTIFLSDNWHYRQPLPPLHLSPQILSSILSILMLPSLNFYVSFL